MESTQETVEVLYALMDKNGNYSKLAGTSLCSLLENAQSKVRIHFFHDGSIKGKNKANFELLVDKYQSQIIFYNVRELLPEVFEEAERILPAAIKDFRFTEAAMYRILAPQVLTEDIKRLIYLDADTIVNIDIGKLWREKIKGGMSAVRENDVISFLGLIKTPPVYQKTLEDLAEAGVTKENCFNSGVLLMDLEHMRTMGNLMLEGLKVLTRITSETNFYDQLILNYYFAKNMQPLSGKYNILQYWDRLRKSAEVQEGIYHYSAHTLRLDPADQRDTMYWKYFLMTPWSNEKFFCRFNSKLEGMYRRRLEVNNEKIKKMLSLWAQRKLVVAYSESQEEAVKKVFPVDACYLPLGTDNSLQLHLDYDVDTHFYLFFVNDYLKLNVMLSQAGLREGEQYGDGIAFFKDKAKNTELFTVQQLFEKL